MNEKTNNVTVDPKLKEMRDRAIAAQAQSRAMRKEAPSVGVKGVRMTIPQKDLIDKYAKIDGTKGQDSNGGDHYMFGDRDLTDQYPDQGYEPVLDRGAGGTMKQVSWQGDPMWKIPSDLYKAQLEENAKRALHISRSESEAQTANTNRSGVMNEEVQTAATDSAEAQKILHEAGVD